jgi:hypothetical protein
MANFLMCFHLLMRFERIVLVMIASAGLDGTASFIKAIRALDYLEHGLMLCPCDSQPLFENLVI